MPENSKYLNLHDAMAAEEQQIVELERKLQKRKERLALLKEILDEAALAGIAKPNVRNPAYAPRGSISGTQGAEEYLRQRGESDTLVNVYRGALALGAKLSYTAIHQMIRDKAKKGQTFTRGPARGEIGLLEWN